jgi:hypothetical protein
MSQILSELSFEISISPDNLSNKTDFDDAIEESIDATLCLLGKASMDKIYSHLEIAFGLKKEDIPKHIEEFAYAFEKTFGSVAKLLEIKIIERLHSKCKKFSYTPLNEDVDFVEFINNFRKYLET